MHKEYVQWRICVIYFGFFFGRGEANVQNYLQHLQNILFLISPLQSVENVQ